MHMLRTPLMCYDKLYFIKPNHHQNKIRDLKNIMNKISEKVGYQVLEFGGQNDTMNTSECPDNNRKVVIFDDLINVPEKKFKITSPITLQTVGTI